MAHLPWQKREIPPGAADKKLAGLAQKITYSRFFSELKILA
jgi:hypothetical protein